jgi:dTDP-4-amino-4,6-dideoxygalactose transaminase
MIYLEENLIQSRPVWHLNHLQKKFSSFQNYKISKSLTLLENSLCIPSSSHLTDDNINKIINVLNG